MEGDGRSADAIAEAAKQKAETYVGRVVAERYRVEEIIALGGMGAVFRAEHVHMRKRVALKLLHPSTQGLPELVARFERESIVGAHVTHPNVCSASDFGKLDDGSHYLVLEYVEGRTLRSLIKEGPMAPARAAEIARQIAAGLGAAHELKIFHRDLKPGNVMLANGSRVLVKIIDFGLAKLPVAMFPSDELISVTTSGTVFGTIAYMAPELARGMELVDHRSDLYALGINLYEMLSGKHPFDAKEPAALFKQHRFTPPPPFAERAPGVDVPAELEAVVRKLLEKEPAARFQSCDELIDALDRVSPPESIPSRRRSTTGSQAPSGPTSSRKDAEPNEASPAPSAASGHVTAQDAKPERSWPKIAYAVGGIVAAIAMIRIFAPEVWYRLGIESPPQVAASTPSTARPSAAISVATPPSTPAVASATVAPPVASASAAVVASDAPSASAPPSAEVIKMRGVLNEAAAQRDAKRGAQALAALAKAAPESFKDHEIVASAAAIAVAVELGDRSMADDVYSLLTSGAIGTGGPDVLFHVTAFYGGSRAAARASDLLSKPEILAQASPALRIVRDLKSAPCKERPALYDRAATDGDERVFTILTAMAAPGCVDAEGTCCAQYDPKLAAAVTKLRERLRK